MLFASNLTSASSIQTCEHLNATTTYTVQAQDTILPIANHFNRNVCDIARYNHLADTEMIYAGEELYIPPPACTADASTSCLLTPQNTTTNTCIYGGPHTYETFKGDTIRKIALGKFSGK